MTQNIREEILDFKTAAKCHVVRIRLINRGGSTSLKNIQGIGEHLALQNVLMGKFIPALRKDLAPFKSHGCEKKRRRGESKGTILFAREMERSSLSTKEFNVKTLLFGERMLQKEKSLGIHCRYCNRLSSCRHNKHL